MSEWLIGTPGWYGKVAFLGDFASRRLDAGFVARWDGWLQEVIPASRAALGQDWLGHYLSSAIWRFIDHDASGALHAGVLMPSVDNVGRYFPLCIAGTLSKRPTMALEKAALGEWFAAIEQIALQALRPQTTAESFDGCLAILAPRDTDGQPEAGLDQTIIRWNPQHAVPAAAATLKRGDSLWWIGDGDPDVPAPFASRGLPDSRRFTSMLQATPR